MLIQKFSLVSSLFLAVFFAASSLNAQPLEADILTNEAQELELLEAEIEGIFLVGCSVSLPAAGCTCSASGAGATCDKDKRSGTLVCSDSEGTTTCRKSGNNCSCTTVPATN